MNPLSPTRDEQVREFVLAGLPDGWLRLASLILLAAMLYVVFRAYRAERRSGVSLPFRMVLGSLRAVVLILLALVWLEPVIATHLLRTTEAKVLVLVDVSESTQIADAGGADGGRESRAARALSLVHGQDDAWLKRLAEKNRVALYHFGERARRAPTGEAAAVASAPATHTDIATYTDLGQSLADALEDAGEAPIAAVIVFTDGAVNSGMKVEDVAAFARRSELEVHPVGLGLETEPPNLRVAALHVPAAIARGDPVEARVEIAAEGVERRDVQLQLLARRLDVDAEEVLLESRSIPLGGEAGPVEQRFDITADLEGEYEFSARVAPLEDEPVQQDNGRVAIATVLDEKLRVLVVAGRPTYDYQFVTRLFERDRTIDVSCWLQSADPQAVRDGDVIITSLPRKPEEIFAYDAILLIDPDPREFDSAWAIHARRFVDEFGGGVLFQAGNHYATRFLRDPRLEDLVRIFPIVTDADADVRLSNEGTYRTKPFPFELVSEAAQHPIVSFDSDAERNLALWKALPGGWWRLPVLREKPLATVLLRGGGGSADGVLLATQPFGAGRTVFLGFDSTRRWRATAEELFNRFWIQTARYLGYARREGASKRGTIVLDRDEITIGDFLRIEARVLDADFVPWHASQVQAIIELADGNERGAVLIADPQREGWFVGRLRVDFSGAATIRVPLPPAPVADAGGQETALLKRIRVQRPDAEMRSLRQHVGELKALAEATGGTYWTLEEAAGLPERIASATRTQQIDGRSEPLWDRGWVMGLIAALLAVEWTLRRRNHLL